MKKPAYFLKVLYSSVVPALLLGGLIGDEAHSLRKAPAMTVAAAPSAAINSEVWQAFERALHQRAQRFGGTAGYIVKDLRTGQVVMVNADRLFPSASLIKLPVMVAAFQAVEDRKLALSETITLKQEDKRGGSGVLKFAAPGTVFTIRDLLEAMICTSDNTATELIVHRLGFDYLQATFDRLGLQDTEIHPEGFRLTGRHVAEDNRTSPRDMAFLLEKIYQKDIVSRRASEEMLVILKHQKLRDRLPRYLPTGWEIAHKTGLLRRACHDCGIVFSPSGDYLVCVLTSHDTAYRTAKRFIASIGRITFDYYDGGFHKPILQTRAQQLASTHLAS